MDQIKKQDQVCINLDSMFTPYTLDTYQTFTLDDQDIPDNIEYDHAAYLQDLAQNRLELLKKNILDNVIIDILEDGPAVSPEYYNYSTDNAFNNYLVDQKALDQYIKEHRADYEKNKIKSGPGFFWLGDDNQTKLNYYLRAVSAKLYDDDQYFYDQIETVQPYEYRIDN